MGQKEVCLTMHLPWGFDSFGAGVTADLTDRGGGGQLLKRRRRVPGCRGWGAAGTWGVGSPVLRTGCCTTFSTTVTMCRAGCCRLIRSICGPTARCGSICRVTVHAPHTSHPLAERHTPP